MELQGRLAVLSPEEQRVTGLPSPITVKAISVDHIENRLQDRRSTIVAEAGNKPSLAERARLNFEREELARDVIIVNGITKPLFEREVSLIPAE